MEQEINLYSLLKYYARNWLNLLIAILLGTIVGLVYTFYIQQPLYRSEATMLVVGARSTQEANINNNYTELFRSRLVLQPVIEQQGYSADYSQLQSRTTATNDRNTDILRVSIADPDPSMSQQLLQASLGVFKKEASSIYETDNIRTVDSASLPTQPYNVNVLVQVGIAQAALFLFVLVVMFFVYDYRMSQGDTPERQQPKGGKGKGKKPRADKPAQQPQAAQTDAPSADANATAVPAAKPIPAWKRMVQTLVVGTPPQTATKKTK